MSEIKVGDQVAIGPGTVMETVVDGEDIDAHVNLKWYRVYCEQNEIIPWHPALPALARWLSEHPDGAIAVEHAIGLLRGQISTIRRIAKQSPVREDDAFQANTKVRIAQVDGRVADMRALLDALNTEFRE